MFWKWFLWCVNNPVNVIKITELYIEINKLYLSEVFRNSQVVLVVKNPLAMKLKKKKKTEHFVF